METQFVERLTAREIQELMVGKECVLVDTLPPEHFESRHIPGAVNACVYEVAFLSLMEALVPDKETSLVLYGAGEKSQDCVVAADKLGRAGYHCVSIFPGGLGEWREENRPLAGSAPDTVEAAHPPLLLASRPYSLIPEESEIQWTGRNANSSHTGSLALSRGTLDARGELAGKFVIDMNSLRNFDLQGDALHSVLEGHLHSDDFFFTTLFPEARFETSLIRIVEKGEVSRPNAMMQGALSLRGISNEIAFPVHIRNLDEKRIVIVGNLDFDRTQWGIIYGASRFFQYLGYHTVFDFISVDFRLVLAEVFSS